MHVISEKKSENSEAKDEWGGGVTSEYITMQENSTGSNKCARAYHISGWQGIKKKEKIGGM